MSDLLVIKDKVGRYLKEVFDQVTLGDDGEFLIPYDSTLVVVRVLEITDHEHAKERRELGLPTAMVDFFATVLFDVKTNSDLFRWISTVGQSFDYGGFRFDFNDESEKDGTLVFGYSIAANTLDAEEVKNAIVAVASVANGNDEDLKKLFGGRRFIDQ